MQPIDIAVFNFPNDAYVLESLLTAENIPHVFNYQNTAVFIPGSGVALSVNVIDRERAVKIIKEAGFERYLIN